MCGGNPTTKNRCVTLMTLLAGFRLNRLNTRKIEEYNDLFFAELFAVF